MTSLIGCSFTLSPVMLLAFISLWVFQNVKNIQNLLKMMHLNICNALLCAQHQTITVSGIIPGDILPPTIYQSRQINRCVHFLKILFLPEVWYVKNQTDSNGGLVRNGSSMSSAIVSVYVYMCCLCMCVCASVYKKDFLAKFFILESRF